MKDRLCITPEGLQARSGLTAAPISPLAPGKRRSTPQSIPRCEGWLPHARSSVFVGILLGKAVPDEVWLCGHSAGGCGLVRFWRPCDCLAPGIPLAAINVVWVLVLYFGSRLRSRPAGQASSDWILWCPRECQKALVHVARACFGWENTFLSPLFGFSVYPSLGQNNDPALCQQKKIEVPYGCLCSQEGN